MALLSDEDARILGLERGPVRGHTCKVLVVAGRHDAGALTAHIEPQLATAPRLLDRLQETGAGPPAWIPDPDFALDRHVLDGGTADDHAALERAVAALMEARLDRDRPLWSIHVIALGRDRTAFVLRLHHCIADGMTAMRIVRTLLLDQGPATEQRPARTGSAETLPAADRHGRLAALQRELAPTGRPSPLARRAGPHRTVAFSSFALEEVKAIGHDAPERATVNDVVLAAVAGGLRHWLAHIGATAHELRVKVPVSLHHPGEPDLANRDSFMFVQLPIDTPEPLARLSGIAAETRERKAAHDADALDALFSDAGRWSRALRRVAERWAMSPRVFALNVSNVPGPQGELTVMGSPLLALYSLSEIAERHLLRVAVVSAADRLSFGLCADAEAVSRLDLVADGIAQELRALRAALPA